VLLLGDLSQLGLGRQTKQLIVGEIIMILVRVQPLLPQKLLQFDPVIKDSHQEVFEVDLYFGV